MDVVRLHALSRQLKELALAASRARGDLDISVAQLAVIETVARTPGGTVAQITRTTGLAQSWVSTIVRELAEADVFALGKDPGDGRRTLVSLTPAAARLTFDDRGTRAVDSGLARAVPHLDAEGVRRVVALLTEVESLLRPDTRSDPDPDQDPDQDPDPDQGPDADPAVGGHA